MPLNIITAEERLKPNRSVKLALLGEYGIGKTTQLLTMDQNDVFLADLEAGDLAVQQFTGKSINVFNEAAARGIHPWEITKALTCWLCGPSPSAPVDSKAHNYVYSKAAYDMICSNDYFGDPKVISPETHIFMDSITKASLWAFDWSQRQEESFSEKTGKPDTRGAYGLVGRELVTWLTHIQHGAKSAIVAGILDTNKDDLGRITHDPQIAGSMTAKALPGIFDQVTTLTLLDFNGAKHRAFVNTKINDWNYPAKDRSGCLGMVEEPHLGKLLAKIRAGKRLDNIVTSIPTQNV